MGGSDETYDEQDQHCGVVRAVCWDAGSVRFMFGFWAACVGTHCVRVDEAAGGPVPFGVRCRRAVGSAHFVLVQAQSEKMVNSGDRVSSCS